jgi:hypothetical protein
LTRLVDTATLAAVVELPYEQEAIDRAIEYIKLNGYRVGQDTEIRVRGCLDVGGQLRNVDATGALDPTATVVLTTANPFAGYVYQPVVGNTRPHAIFVIDTLAYQPVDRNQSGQVITKNSDNCTTKANAELDGMAHKLRITGQVNVDTNFVRFLGWTPTISEQALAKNVISLDVVIVFDVTGSMEPEAKIAVKKFVQRLQPQLDQVAFVPSESNGGESRSKLQCLQWAQRYAGGRSNCYGGSNPITFTHVLKAIETYQPSTGSHDIATGLREGLAELGIGMDEDGSNTVDSQCTDGVNHSDNNGDGHACDRRGTAKRVLILLTDGTPDENPGGCAPSEGRPDFWDGLAGPDDDNYECAMYYAWQAAQNDVRVYAIGLGEGVNTNLLHAIATGTGSNHEFYFEDRGGRTFVASSEQELDQIFFGILSNPGPRIVGMVP